MPSVTTMPWGRYRGEAIEELPSRYLRWAAERAEDEDVAAAADEELRWRDDHDAHHEDEPGERR